MQQTSISGKRQLRHKLSLDRPLMLQLCLIMVITIHMLLRSRSWYACMCVRQWKDVHLLRRSFLTLLS